MKKIKFVLAPDSFKESMTAKEAAECMERGLRRVFPEAECIHVPMADGGEGTVQSLIDATGGRRIELLAQDPLGREIPAYYALLGDEKTAVIEMAIASGLERLRPEERNPLITSTYGTGQLIADALKNGVDTILIGIGGSATNDGGAGMFQALGGRLLDANGAELPLGGGALEHLQRIDASALAAELSAVKLVVACDVDNPLTGERGASAIFGPQKGATPAMVERLDQNLKHFAKLIREQLDRDIEQVPGAGAAGGLGGGLMAFLNAQLQRGVEIVIEHTKLAEKMTGATMVLTGEGGIDQQTRFGKTPYGVAQTAKRFGLPVVAFAGTVKADSALLYDCGFDAIFSIMSRPCELSAALREGPENLARAVEVFARALRLGQKLI